MAHLAPMNNGCVRYICQLKRLTLQYCKNGGSSRGIREFLSETVAQFAKENPHLTVYVRQRPGRHPRIVAEFLSGNSRVVSVKNMSVEEVAGHISLLRTSSGIKTVKLAKPWHTDNPSIQGNWTPFLYK
ncbi:39S ribosomal protein L43, mitochondrial [Geodia barretti]|uniref:Large ribosomal subunit protein mL43 n=1 Tax=Geodia barretti TaxID=519541 RepID=A0AA35U2B8_GEOBA|nr:39S ribosomal protein L43, mitochondrial [Geodia barretti]